MMMAKKFIGLTREAESRLRDEFAIAALQGMYMNADLVKKAVDDWDVNGGPRPMCVAEWFAGMAYEAADAALVKRKEVGADE